ncbi:hypothetical protein RGU74_26925 [Bacillus cereus]|nr:hypothetical protein [Bacillus cereus]MDR4987132.1 hypothetical protein [Bacillus cereus]
MKSKLIKAVLSIVTVACLSVTAFQFADNKPQAATFETSKYMVDPGPGGG